MRNNIRVAIGYFIVWLGSGASFYFFSVGNHVAGVISALASITYCFIVGRKES